MIDVHCHIEHEDFDLDRDELIKKLKGEIRAIITSATNIEDLRKALKIVSIHKNFVFLSAGLHPIYANSNIEEFLKEIKREKEHIVAIGEIGLDYYWGKKEKERDRQKEIFTIFLELAKKIKKPVVVHCREAFDDCLEIIKESDVNNILLHMFGSKKHLNKVIEYGYFVSSNAIILTSKSYRKIVKSIPIDRLMLETDSPWLHPKRERNTPFTIKTVAKKVAEIKKLCIEEVENITDRNAIDFFNLNLKKNLK